MREEGFAIVTGGARGLGKGIVLQLAKEGYDVVFNYISDSSLARAQAVIEQVEHEYGVRALAVQGDTSDYEQCKKMIDLGIASFGDKIAVLVNNAGIAGLNLFVDRPVDQYSRLIQVNLLSVFHNTHVVLPYMIAQKSGVIINMSSQAGLNGVAYQVDYSAAKAGVIGFTKALAKEVGQHHIRVNAIAPGNILTDIWDVIPAGIAEKEKEKIPLGEFGTVEDVAECMSYLLNASFVTGQTLSPNGGQTI